MNDRVDLEVPYAEKEDAKAIGARWDPDRKTWYVPPGRDRETFRRWLPQASREHGTELLPQVFIVESQSTCWRCGAKTKVVALASESYVDHDDRSERHGPYLFLFSDLRKAPEAVVVALKQMSPGYRRDRSHTAGTTYYMNHCSCGAKLGDFFIHSEPGGAFFPMTPDEAREIRLHRLKVKGRLLIDGSPGTSVPNLINEYAVRVST